MQKVEQSSARSSQRGARGKRGSEAQGTPQLRTKRGGAGAKGDSLSTPAAPSDDPPVPRPQKKLTVKLTRKGKDGATAASSASPPIEAAHPLPPASSDAAPPPSSDFRSQLKDLADSEDEDGGNVVKPKKRRGGGAAIADDDEEDEDAEPASRSASRTSIVLKRKRKEASSDGARRESSKKKHKKRTLSQPERTTDSDEDFVGQGDDSDEVMSDVGSEESASGGEDYAERASGLVDGDEDFTPIKGQKKQAGAKAVGKAAKKSETGESSAAAYPRPPPKKAEGSAAATSKAAGPRKGSSKVEPKTVTSTIRASAAATSTSTTSSPAGSRPFAAGQAGAATQKRPPQMNKPKASLSMWDSLVGSSSKPAAPAQPPKPAQPKEEQKVGGEKEGEKAKDPNQPRATPSGGLQGAAGSSASSLPRPLGINRPQGIQSSTSASQTGSSSTHGHGHGNFRDSTISIHVTPGLNGQHWDKAAYRSLRLSDKERYRLPAPGELFDLLEDAEVIVGFEEEWRAKRIMAGAGGQARYASSKATQYGAGRDYARGTVKELLKGRRKAPAVPVAAGLNGSTEGGAQLGEGSKQLTG